MKDDHRVTRRMVLGTLSAFAVTAAAGALIGTPGTAQAQALGQNESVEDALKRIFGARPIKDGAAVIKLDLPLIAGRASP